MGPILFEDQCNDWYTLGAPYGSSSIYFGHLEQKKIARSQSDVYLSLRDFPNQGQLSFKACERGNILIIRVLAHCYGRIDYTFGYF